MNTEELKRLAEAVLKAYSGLSWQVTMVRDEHGVTHYHIRSHSEPGIAVIKDQYWEDDHIPPVDHYGYTQPDDRMDCDVFRVDTARLIAAANPAAILALIQQRDELLAALRESQLVNFWVSCQSGVVERCQCAGCIDGRIQGAIAKAEAQS